ncbi:hypothetical protein I79_010372 [Cricetulus griseus]|uniref:Uncharacterized protein n=1 Tax=Cricetulus griseus TaxID=10029 RepID=G3HIA5_CRIGR|nr:hypothetical protein I79_010372 [Cricetulus griseus]
MHTDLHSQRVIRLLGLAKSAGHPRATSSSSWEPRSLTWGEPAQRGKSPGAAPGPATRDAVAAEAERALLSADDAVSCPAPRTAPVHLPEYCTPRAMPKALHLQCNAQCNAQCNVLRPTLPLAAFCTRPGSAQPCNHQHRATAVHRQYTRLALRNPPTRCSLALASCLRLLPPQALALERHPRCGGHWAPMAPAFRQEPSAALYRKLLE